MSSVSPTMRELLDLIEPRERIDLDVPLAEINADQLIDVALKIDALCDRVEDAIFDRLLTTRIEEAEAGPSSVPPETIAQRSQRDARRRDQTNQLNKKQAAIRASMGT